MTQRIFDTDNKEDMALLWSILPDNIEKVKQKFADGSGIVYVTKTGSCVFDEMKIININWHINWNDKKEITRPIQEATEADIGKLCRFSLSERARCSISLIEEHDMFGILTKINNNGANTLYLKDRDIWFNHCRRLTKQEIKELC